MTPGATRMPNLVAIWARKATGHLATETKVSNPVSNRHTIERYTHN